LGAARVNSIHHQGVKSLGKELAAEALSVPDEIVEALRWRGSSYVMGVQWHPEFLDPNDPGLLNGEPLLVDFLAAAEKARVLPGGEAKR
jgi:putative glutamine amidotransferase